MLVRFFYSSASSSQEAKARAVGQGGPVVHPPRGAGFQPSTVGVHFNIQNEFLVLRESQLPVRHGREKLHLQLHEPQLGTQLATLRVWNTYVG